VDHSGYALLNIGDIAMLQACVRRLETLWPDADIQVFTESPERLGRHCPEVSAVAPTIMGSRGLSVLPMSSQLAGEHIWKAVTPLLARPDRGFAGAGASSRRPRLLDAVRQADVVVSSGGGFVNDIFWWHAAGVLSVLAMAQRLGKPTAMFGQGVGPLTHPLLSRLVERAIPRLMVIGLREGLQSVPILSAHGVRQDRMQVTGDDALILATRATRKPTGTALGLNVRVASYSGFDASIASQVVGVTRRVASRRSVATIALPVSRYEAVSDLRSSQISDSALRDDEAGHEVADLQTPQELKDRIARCRVVVTGSYHAAVFAVAAGIPTVCLTNSVYYDRKFQGLAAQFPGGCQLVRPGPRLEHNVTEAIDRAWESSEACRDGLHAAAVSQVAMGDQVYERFKALAESSDCMRNSKPKRKAPRRFKDRL
jgi:colanic acid/amylovoran biosynthesis protein